MSAETNGRTRPRVIVLGAGVVGIVTAYYLARQGHDVVVVDQAERVASGTSFANAGQLSYSFTDALGRPAFLGRLPSLMLNRDPAVLMRMRRDRAFVRWAMAFLRECTPARARANTVAVLKLAMRSASLMAAMLDDVPLDFAHRRAGKLVVISGRAELVAAREAVVLKCGHGCMTEILTLEEACRLEPALLKMERDFSAAVYSAGDEVADACAFTQGLANWLEAHTQTKILLGERAIAVTTGHGRVSGVRTADGAHAADAVVVCLGCDSDAVLRPLGLPLPIYPVRGYSVTLPVAAATPSVSVTHPRHRIVFSRLGDSVRIAGFADFVDTNTTNDSARIEALVNQARRIAPFAADYDVAERHPWGGFRPMTPDSRPVVGATRIPGLFVNAGHGMLGWTLACATGEAVAAAVGG